MISLNQAIRHLDRNRHRSLARAGAMRIGDSGSAVFVCVPCKEWATWAWSVVAPRFALPNTGL